MTTPNSRIRTLRLAHGWRTDELAAEVIPAVTHGRVSQIERSGDLRFTTLERFAAALGVDVVALVDDDACAQAVVNIRARRKGEAVPAA